MPLIRYLYGPGRHNEHRDPHVVAGFRIPAALEPAEGPDGERNFRHLIDVLGSPLEAMRYTPPDRPVWQCSLRTAPTDRWLSDAEWAEIAEEVMHQVGIVPRGDEAACRWIAVRHADDHIHLVAVLAREDGRAPHLWRDFVRLRGGCRMVEDRYGLARTAPADRTAAPRPTRAESEQARRKGWPEPPRSTLRRHVAATAAGAETQEEFFTGLQDAGLLVRPRFSSRNPGQITGYAVALPGHVNRAGEPVWFSGGKLAPDLTLPKLHRRWTADPVQPSARTTPDRTTVRSPSGPIRRRAGVPLSPQERNTIYRHAARAAGTAAWQMRWIPDPRVRADLASAASDVLHVAAALTGNRHLQAAADSYDRAAREPYCQPPPATPFGAALRSTARLLARIGIGRGDKRRRSLTVELLMLIANLADLADAVAELRALQQRHAQAAAARTAATRLHAIDHKSPAPQAPTLPRVPDPRDVVQLAAADFPIPLGELLDSPLPNPPTVSPPGNQGPPRRRGPAR